MQEQNECKKVYRNPENANKKEDLCQVALWPVCECRNGKIMEKQNKIKNKRIKLWSLWKKGDLIKLSYLLNIKQKFRECEYACSQDNKVNF